MLSMFQPALSTRPSVCTDCTAREFSICSALPEAVLGEFAALGRNQTLRAGETLLWEDEDALVVGNLRSGLLKLTASLDDGREQILGLAFPGDFIGRPFATRADHRVTALTDATLCVFRRSVFESFAADHPRLEHALLVRAFDELEQARRWLLLLGRKSASERVASLLQELAQRQGKPGEPVQLAITRQQMADLLGLTIETVSRKLTLLKRAGVIALPNLRSFRVLDRERLADEAGG